MGKEDPRSYNGYHPRALRRQAQSQRKDRTGMRKIVSSRRVASSRQPTDVGRALVARTNQTVSLADASSKPSYTYLPSDTKVTLHLVSTHLDTWTIKASLTSPQMVAVEPLRRTRVCRTRDRTPTN